MSIKPFLLFVLVGAFILNAADSPAVASKKALDLLLAGKYAEFSQLLTPVAKERLTLVFLQERVGAEIKGFGNLEQINSPVTAKSGADTLVSYPIKFSKVTVAVQLTMNDAGHVAGLFFRPAESPLPPEWKRPAYSRPELFHEREITVGDGEWKLPGTITIPNGKGPFAAVVLVHGPGPNDRDETLYSNHIFKDIAEGLASRNIVVLRYDKRSKTHGLQMSSVNYKLQEETVEDAVKALRLLRTYSEVNPKKVFLIAHSLGGYAMPRIAAQDGKLAGAVILAGNSRPIEDVVLDQNEYMLELRNGGGREERERLQGLKEEVAKVKALGPGRNNPPVVLGLPVDYLLDLKNYNPAAEAARLDMPMLFLQGQRDIQVTMKDLDRWKAALTGKKTATFKTYPSLNHLFIEGSGPGSPAEYRRPGNVAAEVLNDISKWLERN